eukprot:COSAG02_NODE_17164_length_1024_cov_1.062703_1_plen_195_part_00
MASHMNMVVVRSELVLQDREVKVGARAFDSLADFVSDLREHLNIGEKERLAVLYEQDGAFVSLTTAKLKEVFPNDSGHEKRMRVRVDSDSRDLLDMVSDAIAKMVREHKDDGQTDEVLDQGIRTQLTEAGVPKNKWAALSGAFDKLDVDRDKKINKGELLDAIQAQEESLSTRDIEDLWEEIGMDQIDFAGFCK